MDYRNNESLEDNKLRELNLLTKAFLHNIHVLVEMPNFHLFWLKMLKRMVQDLKIPNESVLYESTLQSLSNILNIMKVDGIFDRFFL